nr:hypothetical protein [Tanacetum cinerariifolium]
MVAASKVPMLKPGIETVIAHTTNEKGTNKAIEKRFGGNVAIKKTQKNLLRQQYENFTASSFKVLDQTFDSLQKLISQLKILGECISQEDVKKFLKSLLQEWNTHTIVWRNKPEIDRLSLDDLYNNLKIYEPKVKRMSSLNTNTQNVAFVFSNSTSSTNGAVNTVHGATTSNTRAYVVNSITIDNLSDAVICAFFASQPNTPHLDNEDLQQIHLYDLEEIDLRASRNQVNKHKESTRRSVLVETPNSSALVSCDGLGENVKILKEQHKQLLKDLRTSKINSITYTKGLEYVEVRLLVYKKNESVYEEDIKLLKRKIHLREVAITDLRRKLELDQKQKDEIQLTVENFENSSKSLSKLLDYQIVDKCKASLGYNAIPPPYTGNFMPPKPDLSFPNLEEFVNKHIVSESTVMKPVVKTSKAKPSKDKPKVVKKNFGPPLIED